MEQLWSSRTSIDSVGVSHHLLHYKKLKEWKAMEKSGVEFVAIEA